MTFLRFRAPNGVDSRCGVDIGELNDEDALAVVFTELEDNEGMSVTNAIEFLASMVLDQYIYKISLARAKAPLGIQWFEHYPASRHHDGTLDRVVFRMFDHVTGKYSHPEWHPVEKVGLIGLGLVGTLKP